jgi:RimJ/RimL family protein N-acetyltransferase
MRLLPLEPGAVARSAAWLARRENHQWLDFGPSGPILTAPVLALMNRRPQHRLRLYTADDADVPIGLVALSDISATHGTANLWYVLGEKAFGGRGYTTRAVAGMLILGFGELGLHSVQAWAVEANGPSIAVLERNGFRRVGRLRECHTVGGQRYDRVLFDLLRAEHQPVAQGLQAGAAGAGV